MALKLHRKMGQSIVIGDTLVTLTRSAYGGIALLVSAPPDVRVDRLEIHRKRGGETQPHWHEYFDNTEPGDSEGST
jgi:sRNA-binding carbon storage regulator CsrA